MKKIYLFLFFLFAFNYSTFSQGYEIKVNLKGAKDTMLFLVEYRFDQNQIVDTCKKVKNGVAIFKGKKNLDKGVYFLVSQEKSMYFDLIINDSQKFSIACDLADLTSSLKSSGSKDNEQFFSYLKFFTTVNQDFNKAKEQAKGKSKEDSTKYVNEKLVTINENVKKFDADFMEKTKGTFVNEVMNIKTEKEPTSVPKASNGRPDSLYSYYYYKNHFWDGVNFKDERIIRTPFFDDRIKKYFDVVITPNPDSVIVEIDKILKGKCEQDNLVYNILLGHFTYKCEQSKIMGFDKVFCHLAKNYIVNGKAKGVYTEETVKKIKERSDIMCNLLIDSKVSELYLIDTTYARRVLKMGFDTAKTSQSVTYLYEKNIQALTSMFTSLYQINAKYTVLVFWASDCGHCKTEIPKLHKSLAALKGKVDYKVLAVNTKEDVNEWTKFIIDNKLSDFIHTFDPVHINNLKDKFDIYSTPVIYLLDKEKRIKAKRLGSEQVIDVINMIENSEKMNKK